MKRRDPARRGVGTCGLLCLCVTAVVASCQHDIETQPSSHCSSFLNPGPAPGAPDLVPGRLTIPVGGYGCLQACYHGDRSRPDDDGSVRWRSLDPTIATVFPEWNRKTEVTGVREGSTTVRAEILGVMVDARVQVLAFGLAPSGPGCFGNNYHNVQGAGCMRERTVCLSGNPLPDAARSSVLSGGVGLSF